MVTEEFKTRFANLAHEMSHGSRFRITFEHGEGVETGTRADDMSGNLLLMEMALRHDLEIEFIEKREIEG